AGAPFAASLTKPVKQSQLYEVLVRLLAGPDDAGRAATPAAPVFDSGLGERLPLRILVAEDVTVNQRLMVALLARPRYRARGAGEGRRRRVVTARLRGRGRRRKRWQHRPHSLCSGEEARPGKGRPPGLAAAVNPPPPPWFADTLAALIARRDLPEDVMRAV